MAAFLKFFASAHGAVTTAKVIARLNAIEATLSRPAHERPVLVCRWQQDANGGLSSHWEIEAPDVPVPPH
jgi:hypothetical protein